VASEPHQARCQGEARRPEARRPVPCETLDNWTQTDEELNTAPADGAAGAWDTGGEVAYQVDDLADEPPGTAAGAGGDVAPSSASTFLRRPMEYMAELEMAIRSTVEVFAENMEISLQRHAVTFPEPRAPAHGVRSHASQSRAARFLGLGRQLTGAAASSPEHHHRGTPLAEEGSDGEDGHADDAEVSRLTPPRLHADCADNAEVSLTPPRLHADCADDAEVSLTLLATPASLREVPPHCERCSSGGGRGLIACDTPVRTLSAPTPDATRSPLLPPVPGVPTAVTPSPPPSAPPPLSLLATALRSSLLRYQKMGLSFGAPSRSRTITSSRARRASHPTGMSSLPTRSRCSRMASAPLVASVPSEDGASLSSLSGNTCRSRSLLAYATSATWPTTSMSMWRESADWAVRQPRPAAPAPPHSAAAATPPRAREMPSPPRCFLPPRCLLPPVPSPASATSRIPSVLSLNYCPPPPPSPRPRPLTSPCSFWFVAEFGDTLDGEPLGSDRSAPNESDHSADHSGLSGATTHVAHARLGLSSLDPDQQILINNLDSDLLPILEKVACSGGMPPGVRSGRRAPNPRTTALAQRGDETDGYKRVPAKHGATVADLSQISRLPIPPGSVERFGRPHSSRSDNASQLSFGSANSAFSPPSSLLSPSSSSSALASPRPPTGLKASQSTPTIHVSTHKSAHQGR